MRSAGGQACSDFRALSTKRFIDNSQARRNGDRSFACQAIGRTSRRDNTRFERVGLWKRVYHRYAVSKGGASRPTTRAIRLAPIFRPFSGGSDQQSGSSRRRASRRSGEGKRGARTCFACRRQRRYAGVHRVLSDWGGFRRVLRGKWTDRMGGNPTRHPRPGRQRYHDAANGRTRASHPLSYQSANPAHSLSCAERGRVTNGWSTLFKEALMTT